MNARPAFGHRLALPITAQVMILLLGCLVAAQASTLALTLLAPPAPAPQHSLSEVAAALRGGPLRKGGDRPLVRTIEAVPPSPGSPNWLVSERSTAELSRLLRADESDVRLLFYAPPPLAGLAPAPPGPQARLAVPRPQLVMASMVMLGPRGGFGGPGPGPRPGPGGFGGPGPGLGGGGGGWGPNGGPGGFGGAGPVPGTGGGFGQGPGPEGSMAGRGPSPGGGQTQAAPGPGSGGGPAWDPSAAGPPAGGSYAQAVGAPGTAFRAGAGGTTPGAAAAGVGAAGVGAGAQGPGALGPGALGLGALGLGALGPGAGASGPAAAAGEAAGRRAAGRSPLDAALFLPAAFAHDAGAASPPEAPAPVVAPAVDETPAPVAAKAVFALRIAAPPAAPALPPPAALPAPSARRAADPAAAASRPLADPMAPSFFGLRPASYVEGDFVAAWRAAPGRWVVVRPKPEGFPNSWQKRVMVWFALSFAVIAPLGYLFARGLTAPLGRFAAAADRFGRDPTAEVSFAGGPAEIGRAARAFNLMRERLRRHVEDRTGMISSISHDLRTPLARMRFRLARTDPGLREGMERDIAQMEEMIASVLAFLREDAEGAQRQRLDLRSLLECVVDDLGFDAAARLEPGGTVEIEGDPLGLRRVFENLIGNALKYGRRAEIRLSVEDGEAVTEILDEGPGLPEEELERVFQPFYRTARARASSQSGMGLGLAVSRSIVRAHGGEVTLSSTDEGLAARVRLPLPDEAAGLAAGAAGPGGLRPRGADASSARRRRRAARGRPRASLGLRRRRRPGKPRRTGPGRLPTSAGGPGRTPVRRPASHRRWGRTGRPAS